MHSNRVMISFLTLLMSCYGISQGQDTNGDSQKGHRLSASRPLRPNADQLASQRQQVFDYFDRQIEKAQRDRDREWQPDFSSKAAYQKSLAGHRVDLAKMLGLIEQDSALAPAKVDCIGEKAGFRIERVTIPITEGLAARGILFTPRSPGRKPAKIICPDADKWPEHVIDTSGEIAGDSVVFIQQSIERLADHPYCKKARGKDRRGILYRLGFVIGRTMPGLDVQDTLAVVDYLSDHANVDSAKISITGHGQGGMTALLTAALDLRISEVTVSDHFDCRNQCWNEPVDRRLRGQLLEFGDAELAALVAPRKLTLQVSAAFLSSATAVNEEVRRAATFFEGLGAADQLTVKSDALASSVIGAADLKLPEERAIDYRNQHFEERLAWLRKQIDESEANRYTKWRIEKQPKSEFPKIQKAMLQDYRQMTGTLPEDATPMAIRSELALATDGYRAYRVTIDVVEGVDVYGHLLIPLGFEGKRPAVICQHGFGGMPEKISGVGITEDSPYHEVGRKLAEKGYVVFAPTLMHIRPAEDVSRQTRQACSIGMMRVAMPIAKTNRVIDFLETLPAVDKDRIGYYGLSYGGYSAMWMTPLLDRLSVSIASGNFNDWRMKITSDELNTSYLRHPDEDMYSWNCLNRFTHPELLAMVIPRPMAVEYGNQDGITTPAWTARAWKQTVAIRDHLSQQDHLSLYEFDGPHEIHGVETFDFLDRWLKPGNAIGR